MAAGTIPAGGLSLHNFFGDIDAKASKQTALLCKLDSSVIRDAQKAPNSLHFVSGSSPKLRIGKRTIDLNISTEAFRHELYSASQESLSDLNLAAVITNRVDLSRPRRKQSEGADAALALLAKNVALGNQQKQANQTHITDTLLAPPENRYDAAKELKKAGRRGPGVAARAYGDDVLETGFSTDMASVDDNIARQKAMRASVVHLLAMKPLARDEIQTTTRIPTGELDEVLSKIGTEKGGLWQLNIKAYKDLDVWKFAYRSQADRQAAIDNAIKSYDRTRVGKDDNLWQLLLPMEERGKGICLSKIQGQINRNLTPNPAGSPMAHGEGTGDERSLGVGGSPALGSLHTPKVAATKANSLKARLMGNAKQREKEAAKEKKRKEREAAAGASDREGASLARKKQVTVENNPKVKSAELVRESSSDEMAEEGAKGRSETSNSANKPGKLPTRLEASDKLRKAPSTTALKAASSTRPQGAIPAVNRPSETPARTMQSKAAVAKPQSVTMKASPASLPAKPPKIVPPTGRSTPNGLAAPPPTSRYQLSPQRNGTRPHAPSPLGAARPRGVSDVSEQNTNHTQRSKPSAEFSRDAGTANGPRKQVENANKANGERINGIHASRDSQRKPAANGPASSRPPQQTTSSLRANGPSQTAHANQKRKANDSPEQKPEDSPVAKQRKISPPVNALSNGRTPGSESSDSVIESVRPDHTNTQEMEHLERWYNTKYPEYNRRYKEMEAKQARGEEISPDEQARFFEMHYRMKDYKYQIQMAQTRHMPLES